jgi:hypothetical protein
MLLTPPDVSSLDDLLGRWELVEYVGEAFVIIGCVGEFFADFTKLRTEEWRHRLGRLSLLLLISALAVELVAIVRTNSLSGKEIALLNGISADARLRAANAESQVAEAKATAESAKVTAKGFESKIAESNARVKTAEARIASADASSNDAVARVAAAELQVAAQRERAAKAEKDLLEVQEKIKPRRITPEQRDQLVMFLSQPPRGKVDIMCVLGDGEGLAFAEEVGQVLKASGWEIGSGGVSQGAFAPSNPVGFGVLVHSSQSPPPRAISLIHAFRSVGLPLGGSEKKELDADAVQIIVGNKPQAHANNGDLSRRLIAASEVAVRNVSYCRK